MLSSQKINLSKIAAKAITPLVILPYLFLLPFSLFYLALCHGNNSTAAATATTSASTPLYTSASDHPYYLGTLSWMSVQWILHVISHEQIMTIILDRDEDRLATNNNNNNNNSNNTTITPDLSRDVVDVDGTLWEISPTKYFLLLHLH